MSTNNKNIPVDICTYAVKKQCVNQLETYCFIKNVSGGHIYELKEIVKQYIDNTGNTERTFFNHKKWLIREGWLVQCKKGFHVIGYKPLLKKLGFEKPKQKAARFENNFKDFRGFVAAVVITNVGIRKKFTDSLTGANKKGSASSCIGNSFTLPHSYLAKVLGISKSSAQHLREYAMNYLSATRVLQDFRMNPEDVRHFRLDCTDEVKNLVIRNRKVKEQKATIIQSSIIFKRWR